MSTLWQSVFCCITWHNDGWRYDGRHFVVSLNTMMVDVMTVRILLHHSTLQMTVDIMTVGILLHHSTQWRSTLWRSVFCCITWHNDGWRYDGRHFVVSLNTMTVDVMTVGILLHHSTLQMTVNIMTVGILLYHLTQWRSTLWQLEFCCITRHYKWWSTLFYVVDKSVVGEKAQPRFFTQKISRFEWWN
jgi:hypothetical protein